MNYSELNKILKGDIYISKKLTNKTDLINIAEKGLTKQTVKDVAELFNMPLKEIIFLLPISEPTFKKYKPEQRLNKNISEQLIFITDILIKGLKVFEDKEKLLSWLKTPSFVFSNKTPFTMLLSRFGIDLVFEELGRIEHGVFS